MKPGRLAIVVVSVLFVFITLSRVASPAAETGGPPAGAPAEPATGAPAGSPTAARTDWQSSVQRQVAEQEYEVTWQTSTRVEGLDAAWQAPNRAHNLRTYFTASGIQVVPRTEETPSWAWSLEWVGYGRGGRSWSVEPATLEAKGARVDYHRGGTQEWYENTPRGLKQWFVLTAPPDEIGERAGEEPETLGTVAPGRGRGVPAERLIHVDLALSGTLCPVIAEDGLAIDFEAPGGARVVHYAGLRVTDARGTKLPAWMEGFVGSTARGVRIVIEDVDAVYPITVDPLATSPAWMAEGDQVGAGFGFSVGTAGDVNGDGHSDVIAGAPHYDSGLADRGRAFVFMGSASGLAASPAWTAEGDQSGTGYGPLFGYSVSTAGDVNGDGYSDVIIGAYGDDNGQIDEGRAFVHLGSASGLAPSVAWTAESDQAYANFGWSVATAGDVNSDGYSDVIVGDPYYANDQLFEGRAYVYLGSGSGLAGSAAWTAEGDQSGAFFGWSVSTAGDVNGDGFSDVIIGAIQYTNVQAFEGRADVLLGSASGLAAGPAWTAESDQASASFGCAVATAGDVNGDGYADVVVGAPHYDNGQTDEGRAFVYLGSASGLAGTAARTVESDQVSAQFGWSLATAGDVNGDGYADVIFGAPYYDNGQPDQGRAYIYPGSALGLLATPAWTTASDQPNASLGWSVATAGDVNGDGYSDRATDKVRRVARGNWRLAGARDPGEIQQAVRRAA